MNFDGACRAAYLPEVETLAVADLHVGLEASAWAPGRAPRLEERRRLAGDLRAAVERFSPERVVLCGDVLHEFGGAGREVREGLGDLLRASGDAELLLVEGSHDRQLRYALPPEVQPPAPLVAVEGVAFLHGDRAPGRRELKGIESVVAGHVHPTLDVQGARVPCYLHGPGALRGRDLLVLPAFNPWCAGAAVNRVEALPLPLAPGISPRRLEVAVDGPEGLLRFPVLGEFEEMVG